MREPLCFSQISFTPPKCILGMFSFSYIDRCAEHFIDIPLSIEDGTADTFNVFEGPVRQHNSVFKQALLLVAKNLHGALSYPVTIVRVRESTVQIFRHKQERLFEYRI